MSIHVHAMSNHSERPKYGSDIRTSTTTLPLAESDIYDLRKLYGVNLMSTRHLSMTITNSMYGMIAAHWMWKLSIAIIPRYSFNSLLAKHLVQLSSTREGNCGQWNQNHFHTPSRRCTQSRVRSGLLHRSSLCSTLVEGGGVCYCPVLNFATAGALRHHLPRNRSDRRRSHLSRIRKHTDPVL